MPHATWNVWVEIPKPGKSEWEDSNLDRSAKSH